jgi:nucleoid-associated protein YgaU
MAAMVLGLMLEKLTIQVEDGKEIEVLFNPSQISITKNSSWRSAAVVQRDVPRSQFLYSEPSTLSMELFFDTYEDRSDVRAHTKDIFHLTTVEEHGDLHRPPLCKLHWGYFDLREVWILQNLVQRFTLFLEDGTPARATLSCTFRQWRSDDTEARLLNRQSPDVAKTRIVRRGDTLSGIAGEAYKNPSLWRPIAEANGIDDPRDLAPGTVLSIPRLQSSGPKRK